MKNYKKPNYEIEAVDTADIILVSIDLGNGAILTQIDESTAQVGASVNDILGLR